MGAIFSYNIIYYEHESNSWSKFPTRFPYHSRCVGSYGEKNPKKPIMLIGKGANGLSGILSLLEDDIVAYALLRVV